MTTLRSKLIFAQAPVAIALALLSLLFVRTMNMLGADSQNILKDNFRSVLAIQRMKDSLEVLERAGLDRILREPISKPEAFELALSRFENELSVQESNVTERGEAQATAQLRTAWNTSKASFRRGTNETGDVPAGRIDELWAHLAAIRAPADEILSLNLDAVARKNDGMRKLISWNETMLLAAAIVACLVGFLVSGTLTSRLLRPLGVLGQAVRRVGEGDLNARITIEGNDEISRLSREFNALTERMRNYRESSLGELLNAQEAAQASIDSLADPVVVFDANGALINVNESCERMLGFSVETAAGLVSTLDAELAQVLERAKRHVLGGHGAYVPKGFEEAVGASTTEGQRYFLARASPVYSSSAGVAGVTIVLQDVTRVRLFDEMKNDLVATVAHEFRTPLTSLRLAVHLCIEGLAGPITAKQADLLYAAREDTERLQAMVDDLLNVARIQSGHAGLRLVVMPVSELLASVVATQREDAKEHNLDLRVEPAPQGLMVEVDLERLSLAFHNLIANAIQHTPSGGQIYLRVRSTDHFVRFEVSDTGPGIPAEYQGRVFDRFFQVPGSAVGAAGLGLYISKEVVRAHGGEIGLKSEVDKGSTFWFTLPAQKPIAATA